jgi:hypothetical protein
MRRVHGQDRKSNHRLFSMAMFSACVFFAAAPASGQSIDTDQEDTQFWWKYSYQDRLSDNWSHKTDTGYRNLWESKSGNDEWDRFHISTAFSYRKNSRLNLDLGSGLYYTTRPRDSDLFEFRTWEGATVYWPDSPGKVRRFVLTHRFRFEQRFTRQNDTSNWDLDARARYKMSTAIAINRKEVEPGAFYAYVGGELFADLTDDKSSLVSDRSRFSLGLGWLTSKSWTVEALYTFQKYRDNTAGDFRLSDRIVELRVKTTLRVLDRMKAH